MKTWAQAVRYGIVGVSNTVITAVVIWILMKMAGCSEVLSNAVGYVAGVLNSFIWNKQWTFKGSSVGWVKGAIKFLVVFGVCYLLQLAFLMFVLMPFVPIDPYYNQLIAMAFYTILNFLMNKLYTFKV